MSDALFQQRRTVADSSETSRAKRSLPVGVGLLIGAGASAGLWGGLIWLALTIFR